MSFKNNVYNLVAGIPKGKVMSYGQIAALAGSPRAARQVGGLAHYGPEALPWHRVVTKQGGMGSGFPGGMARQQALLEAEGVVFLEEYIIKDIKLYFL